MSLRGTRCLGQIAGLAVLSRRSPGPHPVLWAVLEIVPMVGIAFGLRAVHPRDAAVRAAVAANAAVFLLFTGLTLVGGLSDALA